LVLIRARDEMFASDPSFKRRSVSELNAEAVSFLKDGDDVRCVGAFAKLFRKLLDNHLTHKDLHVCHSNRAAAYLNLGSVRRGALGREAVPEVSRTTLQPRPRRERRRADFP
jgi:protein arginine N-methyltransferase 7